MCVYPFVCVFTNSKCVGFYLHWVLIASRDVCVFFDLPEQ